MFFDRHWNVLIVDDEPDVLLVTKLAMKDFKVYDIPLKLHTATSTKEAYNLLENQFATHGGWSPLAAAFIDVVMESDKAGLELCEHIREHDNNNVTQIFVRTGQPGVAPERDIIDRYNITGYVSKTEATEDRLYALTKPCVRQYRWGVTQEWALHAIMATVAGAGDRKKILEGVMRHFHRTLLAMAGGVSEDKTIKMGIALDDKVIINLGLDPDEVVKLQKDLKTKAATPFETTGDSYTVTDDRKFLISLSKTSKNVETYMVGHGANQIPDFVFNSVYTWLKSLALLWKRAE